MEDLNMEKDYTRKSPDASIDEKAKQDANAGMSEREKVRAQLEAIHNSHPGEINTHPRYQPGSH